MSLLWKTATHWADEENDESAQDEFEGYFHSSPHELAPGTRLTPGHERGVQNYQHARNHKVFLSGNEDVADVWANSHGLNAPEIPDRMHIYEVEPGGTVTHYHGDYGPEAHADHAVVKQHLYTIEADDPDHGWR